jgi:uncharacterized protein (TIGR03435 family)
MGNYRWALVLTLALAARALPAWGQEGPSSNKAKAPIASAPYVPMLAFDVASVRESKVVPDLNAGVENSAHSSKFVARSLPARYLVQVAYGIYPYQITGGPDWFNSAVFNVQAKSDVSVDDRLAKLSDEQALLEKQHMLQVLLADRFGLKIHWETKEMPIYALAVVKNGPRLHAAGSTPPTPLELKKFGDGKIPPFYQNHTSQGQEDIAHGCSMEVLTDALWKEFGTTVVDKTGLTGTYDFVLQFNGAMPDDRNSDPSHWPALVLAISDQVGLKLEPTKDLVSILVVDRMEKPSEN